MLTSYERRTLDIKLRKAIATVLDSYDESIVKVREERKAACRAFHKGEEVRIVTSEKVVEALRGKKAFVKRIGVKRLVVEVEGMGLYNVTPGLLIKEEAL